jgi:exonuclease SbcD
MNTRLVKSASHADWHLESQGFPTDEGFVLQQFTQRLLRKTRCSYYCRGFNDRAVPPTDAVNLLDELLETIVLKLKTPVIAVSGNHDSPVD